ncbi:hypothetical protein J6590_049438 [Homalodisca vitripennis]|nr:hypothetical protein J6590_049438 [Homalodisca vitripennis]
MASDIHAAIVFTAAAQDVATILAFLIILGFVRDCPTSLLRTRGRREVRSFAKRKSRVKKHLEKVDGQQMWRLEQKLTSEQRVGLQSSNIWVGTLKFAKAPDRLHCSCPRCSNHPCLSYNPVFCQLLLNGTVTSTGSKRASRSLQAESRSIQELQNRSRFRLEPRPMPLRDRVSLQLIDTVGYPNPGAVGVISSGASRSTADSDPLTQQRPLAQQPLTQPHTNKFLLKG